MDITTMGAIDCDVHPTVSSISALLPYFDDFWRDSLVDRGVQNLDSSAYPPNAPISARPDWRDEKGNAADSITKLQMHALDRWKLRAAIANCIYGVHMVVSEDMAAAFARAVNDWMVKEWLDKEPRLRASIVVPAQNPELAAVEIDRCAADQRFVQVLLPAAAEMPLGKRHYWPIYAAAERHGLPIGIHAGSSYRYPVTPVGWPSYYVEDYASQAMAFQGQVASLVAEGVFAKFPNLRVVLIESGVTWLPGFLWRFSKFWRGLRTEVPWVDRSPGEIVRDHFRLTVTPMDAPDNGNHVERIVEHLQSEGTLLFSSDFPHWHFDGDDIVPAGFPGALLRKLTVDNPLETYPRLAKGGAS